MQTFPWSVVELTCIRILTELKLIAEKWSARIENPQENPCLIFPIYHKEVYAAAISGTDHTERHALRLPSAPCSYVWCLDGSTMRAESMYARGCRLPVQAEYWSRAHGDQFCEIPFFKISQRRMLRITGRSRIAFPRGAEKLVTKAGVQGAEPREILHFWATFARFGAYFWQQYIANSLDHIYVFCIFFIMLSLWTRWKWAISIYPL